MKVARGRSWQPEIGMEHASRGRRSGNKGVGARWRGRFRIFSARHCSRTKVSHAENSGMTMLFFSLEVAPMSEGDSFTGSGEMARGGLVFVFSLEVAPVSEGDSFTRSGVVRHACRLRRDGTRIAFCFCGLWEVLCVSLMAVAGAGMRSRASRDAFPSGAWERHRFNGGAVAVCFEGCCGGMCWPQERPANRSRRVERQHEGLGFFVWGILSHAREWAARGLRRFEGGCKLKVSWSFPPTPSLRRRPPLSKTPGCVRRASPGKDTCRRAQSPR